MSFGNFARVSFVAALAMLASLGSALAPARAQSDYPNRPIQLIVGFAAGGGNDIFARLVADKASTILGQSVVVENRPGAGGRLSAEYVSQPAGRRLHAAGRRRPARCRWRPRSIPTSNITRPRR